MRILLVALLVGLRQCESWRQTAAEGSAADTGPSQPSGLRLQLYAVLKHCGGPKLPEVTACLAG